MKLKAGCMIVVTQHCFTQPKEGGGGGGCSRRTDRVEVFQSAKRYTPVVQEHGVRLTSWSHMDVVGIYLPLQVTRGAYFDRRHIFLAIRYFSE